MLLVRKARLDPQVPQGFKEFQALKGFKALLDLKDFKVMPEL